MIILLPVEYSSITFYDAFGILGTALALPFFLHKRYSTKAFESLRLSFFLVLGLSAIQIVLSVRDIDFTLLAVARRNIAFLALPSLAFLLTTSPFVKHFLNKQYLLFLAPVAVLISFLTDCKSTYTKICFGNISSTSASAAYISISVITLFFAFNRFHSRTSKLLLIMGILGLTIEGLVLGSRAFLITPLLLTVYILCRYSAILIKAKKTSKTKRKYITSSIVTFVTIAWLTSLAFSLGLNIHLDFISLSRMLQSNVLSDYRVTNEIGYKLYGIIDYSSLVFGSNIGFNLSKWNSTTAYDGTLSLVLTEMGLLGLVSYSLSVYASFRFIYKSFVSSIHDVPFTRDATFVLGIYLATASYINEIFFYKGIAAYALVCYAVLVHSHTSKVSTP